MAASKVRRWRVAPDEVMQLADGREIPCVSRQAIAEATLDAVILQDRMGGVFRVVVARQATDLRGEAVTTHAIVEWSDSLRALDAPEPETPAPRADELDDLEDDPVPPPEEGDPGAARVEPDGLDPSTLEEEDESSIPAALRG